MNTPLDKPASRQATGEPRASILSVRNGLPVAIPVALAPRWQNASPILVFLVSLIAIYSLAERMAEATEALAATLGSTLGGLLNASLNNAPEIIIAESGRVHGGGVNRGVEMGGHRELRQG